MTKRTGIGFFLFAAIMLFVSLPFIMEARLPDVEMPPLADEPEFDPIAFFEGTTEGRGTLTIATGEERRVRVVSQGERQEDGALLLTQEITEGDKEPRTRQWRIERRGEGSYAGTLSDAEGEVVIETEGNRADISYSTGSQSIRQLLVLQGNGTTVSNRLEAYKWGLNVARLDETIVKR